MINELDKVKLIKSGKIFAFIVGVYFITLIITQFKTWATLNPNNVATISVNGIGEVYAVPDIASFSLQIVGEGKDQQTATAKQAEVKQKVLATIKDFAIDEKDYKTEFINTNPKYEWQRSTIYCATYPCPQPEGKSVLVGYTTSETLNIKLRNIDSVGKFYDTLSKTGAQSISGPSMVIDNEDVVISKARKMAIDDARQKARVLAKDLNVRIVRITGFNEAGNYPMPMYAGGDMAVSMKSNIAPETVISKGENKITANVTITYEIR